MRNFTKLIVLAFSPLAIFASEIGTYHLSIAPDGTQYVINTKSGEVYKYDKNIKYDGILNTGGFTSVRYQHGVIKDGKLISAFGLVPQK